MVNNLTLVTFFYSHENPITSGTTLGCVPGTPTVIGVSPR